MKDRDTEVTAAGASSPSWDPHPIVPDSNENFDSGSGVGVLVGVAVLVGVGVGVLVGLGVGVLVGVGVMVGVGVLVGVGAGVSVGVGVRVTTLTACLAV